MGAPEYRGTVCRWTLDKVSSSTIESPSTHRRFFDSTLLPAAHFCFYFYLYSLFPSFLLFFSVSLFFFLLLLWYFFSIPLYFLVFHRSPSKTRSTSYIATFTVYRATQKVKRYICISTKIITSHGQQGESSSCYVKSLRDSSETNGKVVARTLLRFCFCFENRSSTFFFALCRFFLEYLIR